MTGFGPGDRVRVWVDGWPRLGTVQRVGALFVMVSIDVAPWLVAVRPGELERDGGWV